MLRFLMILAAKICSGKSFLIHFFTEENRPLEHKNPNRLLDGTEALPAKIFRYIID